MFHKNNESCWAEFSQTVEIVGDLNLVIVFFRDLDSNKLILRSVGLPAGWRRAHDCLLDRTGRLGSFDTKGQWPADSYWNEYFFF